MAPQQPKPGRALVFTRPLEPDKWVMSVAGNGAQRIYRCKPLACPDFEQVTFSLQRSPTQHPDPKALDKFAKVDLPKSIRAGAAAQAVLTEGQRKATILLSKTSSLKGYPAVVNETKMSNGKKTVFIETAIIFAGPVMIRGNSVSRDRTLAKQSLDGFISNMKIVLGPPVGAAPVAAPPAARPNQGI
jgi:hypothetical protein